MMKKRIFVDTNIRSQIYTRNSNHYDSSLIAVLPPSAFV